MRVFNKFVESKTEPWNKQDIWYDGSIIKLYKEGKWEGVTVDLETVNKLREFVDKFEMFKLVDELPEVGNPNTVYLILSKNAVDKNTLAEYIYINDTWEEIGGSIPLNLLDFSNNVITFAPTKQSIITPDDFKTIVEKYDLINKKGLSLPCLYKKNKSDKLGFGLLVFNYNNSYQRIDIMLCGKFSDENFSKDEQLYNPFNGYVNHAYLYNKNYNILTPLGEYQYKGNIIEKKSITYDKLADSTIESLSEEINKNIEFPDTIFEKGGGEDSAVLKQTDEKEKNTSTGKANIVGGRRNTVASHTSIAGGVDNVIRGSNSLVVGSNNNAYQRDSLVEGYYNITHDVYSHAEGHSNSSRGTASHVEGSYNETTNSNEHAQGKYNKSNTGTIHSVGIGTSNTDRKNAHEIMQDGKHYIYGVGKYDGTNPAKSTDLAKIIKQLQNTLKYSSLTIIIEDWEDFYNKFNQVSYDEAKNNIINARYGDGSLVNFTLWELCDNLMSFSKIDMELKNGNTDKKLQGSYLSRTFNSNNDDCSYEFIFGSIIPDEYGVMIHMVGDSTNECYVNIFEI